MADDDDDWESFSVPTFTSPTASSAVILPSSNHLDGDEEEDLTLLEQPKVSTPSASQQDAARKKAPQEAEALASRIEFALLENETPEEKKVRERRQAEEAEARMVANDLGGSTASLPSSTRAGAGVTGGIAAIPLRNKKDHETFSITIANKLSGSTSVCTTAFMSELTNRLKANITTEGLDALLASLQAARDSRKKVEQVKTKKSKKEIMKEQKAHSDKYGGADDGDDRYDSYSHVEDDFM